MLLGRLKSLSPTLNPEACQADLSPTISDPLEEYSSPFHFQTSNNLTAAVQLALNDVSPSPSTLGTLNGLALTLTAATRTVGPAAFTSLFAAGARTQFLGGYLVWVVLIAIALMGTVAMRWYPDEAKGEIDEDE